MPIQVEIEGPFHSEIDLFEEVITITAGRKQLTLAVLPSGHASARLDNIPGIRRVDGETTAVFTAAKQVLQEAVIRQGMPIKFEVETSFSTMKGWLQTTGKKMFGWIIQSSIDDSQKLRAEVEIR